MIKRPLKSLGNWLQNFENELVQVCATDYAVETFSSIILDGTQKYTDVALMPDQINDYALYRALSSYQETVDFLRPESLLMKASALMVDRTTIVDTLQLLSTQYSKQMDMEWIK